MISFFFNDTATTEIYTLSLHDALPIFYDANSRRRTMPLPHPSWRNSGWIKRNPWFETELLPILRTDIAALRRSCGWGRSEEHTSELQSQSNLVCRLLLEKKKKSANCCR